MFGKKDEPIITNSDKIDTILGKNAKFTGTLKASGLMRIEGQFDGDMECDGDLIIGESASVTANVKARNAIVAGAYEGNICLDGKLELKNTGKLTGDVKAAGLLVEDGAFFNGKCEMKGETQKSEPIPIKKNKSVETSNPT